MVPPERRAWHAGQSSWDGAPDCNDYTIGVCLSNRNDGEEPYAEAQRAAAVDVCAALCRYFAIPAVRITTHALVATPAGRKTDPLGLDLPKFRAAVAAAVSTKKR
jgi:AmpD protein